MANANIDALYVGSVRIKISHFFARNFTFYKWCLTKVAHCIDQNQTNIKNVIRRYNSLSLVFMHGIIIPFHFGYWLTGTFLNSEDPDHQVYTGC